MKGIGEDEKIFIRTFPCVIEAIDRETVPKEDLSTLLLLTREHPMAILQQDQYDSKDYLGETRVTVQLQALTTQSAAAMQERPINQGQMSEKWVLQSIEEGSRRRTGLRYDIWPSRNMEMREGKSIGSPRASL